MAVLPIRKYGDEVLRHAFPIDVEVVGGRVEEGEAGAVGRLLAAVEQRGVEGASELVGRQVPLHPARSATAVCSSPRTASGQRESSIWTDHRSCAVTASLASPPP